MTTNVSVYDEGDFTSLVDTMMMNPETQEAIDQASESLEALQVELWETCRVPTCAFPVLMADLLGGWVGSIIEQSQCGHHTIHEDTRALWPALPASSRTEEYIDAISEIFRSAMKDSYADWVEFRKYLASNPSV